ncbi:1,3-beta-glucanosyltransferase [Colletotrichum higginsianum IMI 349063]|uniref:1,3-beta-glucanosyltransferase n=1 Tax=Colletotrichum higginsianum (strain IMI 349063) TaxID=759273 RepID=A0A1B7Y2C1_COLHI|nr:1,3-beta-glucanosyltransferase [Colletotrichum higginsianum IMI 349063]OBR06132.1 1,3-beta-glucanosyltransferase [Colletotrichum higginsianum IMI 349063]
MRVSNLVSALPLGTAAALAPIEIVGNKFFEENGRQWFMKDDPLVDAEQCVRDANLMKTLGTNAIRIYHVDPAANHDGCMAAFDDAGIYTLIDLDTFDSYILPVRANNPYWNETQFNAYAKVMDTFEKYDNVLGFFIGNEIIALNNQSQVAPFMKAAARDMKAYRDQKGYRKIPVGYSAADIAELRPMLQDYLTCGGKPEDNIDFFGLNSYEWCDPNTYNTSGYTNLQAMAEQFPVPIFFTETGCITGQGPRTWDDQDAIFSQPMVDDWSGAMVYEWIYEENRYGIVSYGPEVSKTITAGDVYDGFTRKGTPIPRSPEFQNLQAKWATITPTGVMKSDYNPTSVSTRECPKATGGWLVDGNVRLPTLGETFRGSFSSSPTATATASGTSASAAPTESAESSASERPSGSGTKQIAGMAFGLVGVMIFFTVWM